MTIDDLIDILVRVAKQFIKLVDAKREEKQIRRADKQIAR